MATGRPIRIPGRWREGYALDFHVVQSVYVGDDEYGHPRFESTRTELGELLFRLKYRGDQSVVGEMVDVAAEFYRHWRPNADSLVPVPASRFRTVQPVEVLASALAERLRLPYLKDAIRATREREELKNVHDFDDRLRLLNGLYEVDRHLAAGRRILLFDDLFRSGATMNAITESLLDEGGATDVFALVITRTRRA